MKARRAFRAGEPMTVYGLGCGRLGSVGSQQAAEGKKALLRSRGHYKARYIMQLTHNGVNYETDGRGSLNLAHLINAYTAVRRGMQGAGDV